MPKKTCPNCVETSGCILLCQLHEERRPLTTEQIVTSMRVLYGDDVAFGWLDRYEERRRRDGEQ